METPLKSDSNILESKVMTTSNESESKTALATIVKSETSNAPVAAETVTQKNAGVAELKKE
jgi:hypothetical protein